MQHLLRHYIHKYAFQVHKIQLLKHKITVNQVVLPPLLLTLIVVVGVAQIQDQLIHHQILIVVVHQDLGHKLVIKILQLQIPIPLLLIQMHHLIQDQAVYRLVKQVTTTDFSNLSSNQIMD